MKRLAIFLSILVLIALHFNYMPRYKTVADPLLEFPGLDHTWDEWTNVLEGGEIVLENELVTFVSNKVKKPTLLKKVLGLPSSAEFVLVQADVLIDSVRGGVRPYERARVYLVGVNSNGQLLWDRDHNVSLLKGTDNWQIHERAIPIDPEMEKLIFGMGLQGATGLMQVRKLSLTPVNEKASFRIISYLLLIMLALKVTSIIWALVHKNKYYHISAITWCCGIIIMGGVLIPGSIKRQLIEILINNSNLILFQNGDVDEYSSIMAYSSLLVVHSGKIGHFVLFGIIALCARVDFSFIRVKNLILILLTFAATTETLQFFTFERQPSFTDILIDGAGILTGIGLAHIFVMFRRSR